MKQSLQQNESIASDDPTASAGDQATAATQLIYKLKFKEFRGNLC